MSIEQDKATARRWFTEIIAQGQLAVADEVFAANHVIHDPHGPPGGWPDGPEGLKMVASAFSGAFTDWNIDIDDQIAERDKVVTRWTARATCAPAPSRCHKRPCWLFQRCRCAARTKGWRSSLSMEC